MLSIRLFLLVLIPGILSGSLCLQAAPPSTKKLSSSPLKNTDKEEKKLLETAPEEKLESNRITILIKEFFSELQKPDFSPADILLKTAVSRYVSDARKEQITQHYNILRQWLSQQCPQDTPFDDIAIMKIDQQGAYAVSIVACYSKTNLTKGTLMPITFMFHQGTWRICPLVTNFDNIDIPLSLSIIEQQKKLLQWASKEIITQQSLLEKKIAEKVDALIQHKRDQLLGQDMSSEKLVEAWLQAMQKQDVLGIAALSGADEVASRSPLERYQQTLQMLNHLKEENSTNFYNFVDIDETAPEGATMTIRAKNSLPSSHFIHITPLNDTTSHQESFTIGMLSIPVENIPSMPVTFSLLVQKSRHHKGNLINYPYSLLYPLEIPSYELRLNPKEMDALTTKILQASLKNYPQIPFSSVEELAKEVTQWCTSTDKNFVDYLILKGSQACTSAENYALCNAEFWEYKKNYNTLKLNSSQTLVTRLIPITPEHKIVIFSVASSGKLLDNKQVHTAHLLKQENSWIWQTPENNMLYQAKIKMAIDAFVRTYNKK